MIERFLRLFKAYRAAIAERDVAEREVGSLKELLVRSEALVDAYLNDAVALRAKCDEWEQRYMEAVKDARRSVEIVADWEAQRMTGTKIYDHAPVVPPTNIDYSKLRTPNSGVHARVLQQQAQREFFQKAAAQFRQSPPPPLEIGHDVGPEIA